MVASLDAERARTWLSARGFGRFAVMFGVGLGGFGSVMRRVVMNLLKNLASNWGGCLG